MKPRTVMITVLLVTAAMPYTLSAFEPDLSAAETGKVIAFQPVIATVPH
jgi:hypothetical protein